MNNKQLNLKISFVVYCVVKEINNTVQRNKLSREDKDHFSRKRSLSRPEKWLIRS